ncbi:FAD/NAD(P)-binding domain-containing protein [Periconia macrospinosa]|uniref:FAD/NAD(P)-binding domain-containing protein n=1 Tax=Periconia macrospinosa TaxID=97972 RepID=A0A2V1E2U4_9PLEO|nr:FAD/NAD(P)-binding domain-containing protein [Periconia macrospinosa]
MPLKIAIIGAGPGGCMFARLLLQHSITCAIFESEQSINYRSQGGTLDLRSRTGLQAMKDAGLWDEFLKHARYDGESLIVCDKDLQTWLKRAGRENSDKQNSSIEAPEIDRATLRRILLESLPGECVNWGYKLKTIQDDLSLVFENGEIKGGYDLIVGGDGAWSKTRKFLSDEIPRYTGIAGYAMTIETPENKAPELLKRVNRGTLFAFSDHRSLSCQQMGDGSLHASFYGHFPEDFANTCGFDVSNGEDMKQHLRKDLADWAPELKAIFENSGDLVTWRKLYMLPTDYQWEHKDGVTLLGDAAHLMSPFAGIGVNNAFNDALILSRRIIEYTKSGKNSGLGAYVKEYETEMFDLAHKAAKLTEGCMNDMMFTEGAPRASIASWVSRHVTAEVPQWASPLFSTVIYTGYALIKLFR